MENNNELCIYINYDDGIEVEFSLGKLEDLDLEEQIKIFLNKNVDSTVKNSYLYIGSCYNNKRIIEKIIVFQNEKYNNVLRNNNEEVLVIKESNDENSKKFFVFSNNVKLGKELYHSRKFKIVQLFKGLNLINQNKRA